jgi:hypothetical protein
MKISNSPRNQSIEDRPLHLIDEILENHLQNKAIALPSYQKYNQERRHPLWKSDTTNENSSESRAGKSLRYAKNLGNQPSDLHTLSTSSHQGWLTSLPPITIFQITPVTTEIPAMSAYCAWCASQSTKASNDMNARCLLQSELCHSR